jgi:hypothetical protein
MFQYLNLAWIGTSGQPYGADSERLSQLVTDPCRPKDGVKGLLNGVEIAVVDAREAPLQLEKEA